MVEEEFADAIAIIMAAVSVAFMVPALGFAYKIRDHLSKALLVLAVSKHLYKYLFMVLGFASVGAVAHFIYHAMEYRPISAEAELLVHITIDSTFILISISLFMTFKTAYGMLRKGSAAGAEVEDKLREAALKLSHSASEKTKDKK